MTSQQLSKILNIFALFFFFFGTELCNKIIANIYSPLAKDQKMGFFQMSLLEVASTFSYGIRLTAFVHLFQTSVYEFKSTSGESMLPTLNTQWDYVHLLKSYKRGRGVQMGDVIVLVKPTDPDERVLKRITGMPGDIIIIDPSNDSVGEKGNQASFDKYIKVPEGHVWVTGDNLLYSLDSRTYSVLPMALIKGKVIAANDFNEGWRNLFGYRKIENNFNEIPEKN